MNCALIGLGNAGTALLQALVMQAPVSVYDADPARLAAAAALGPRVVPAASAADAVRGCALVLLSLPRPDVSRAVIASIAPHLAPGTTVIETSTVSAEDVENLHAVCAARGARVIDAAIVGGTAKLAAGEGVFLIGSREDDAGEAGALLRSISAEAVFLAQRGDGMRAKLAVNAAAHGVYVVLLEAGALAMAQGIPADVFQWLMARESGLMRPLTHRFGERLRGGDFSGGMSVENAAKDSRLAMAAAAQLGVPFETMTAAHHAYERALAAGLGGQDYAVLGKLWEAAAGISFADKDQGED